MFSLFLFNDALPRIWRSSSFLPKLRVFGRQRPVVRNHFVARSDFKLSSVDALESDRMHAEGTGNAVAKNGNGIGNSWQWMAPVGNGWHPLAMDGTRWQWMAPVGNGWQWMAITGNSSDEKQTTTKQPGTLRQLQASSSCYSLRQSTKMVCASSRPGKGLRHHSSFANGWPDRDDGAMVLRFPLIALLAVLPAFAETKKSTKIVSADKALAAYFRAETKELSDRCLGDVGTIADWNSKKVSYREQLFDMLGLSPLPPKTDLKPQITGKREHPDFTVENLHFQSMPGLYVTANFYLPKHATKPVPTVLYVCGHAKVVTNGVSFGNKTAYQHHGAWFARNGYACLTIDTIQLGEIEGIHHGTYRENMWWWNARGYTPAGAEAWNNIRALDYLETRPEVDKTKLGVTGRSGGGAYSWVLSALDDRIKVAAPVAGITDLQNYVVDGAIEGHCDCMFMVNTYRWDYPLLAAMTAPRALMFGNSDKDRIFPLDGVQRTHAKIREIYKLNEATDKLALLITEGPHEDTQDLQLPVFRWFNRHLKGADPLIEMAAVRFFKPEELKVFDVLPSDEINSRLHEHFVPVANAGAPAKSVEEWQQSRDRWMEGLRQKVFAGWPDESLEQKPQHVFSAEHRGVRLTAYDFFSQPNVPLRIYFLQSATGTTKGISLRLLDSAQWTSWVRMMEHGFADELAVERRTLNKGEPDATGFEQLRNEIANSGEQIVYFAPRGIGLSAWSGDAKKQTHLRRRFLLLGQTLDSMRVWDVRRAIQAVDGLETDKRPIGLQASGMMAANALYASLFEPASATLQLSELPKSHRAGPDYLNILRVMDISQAVAMAVEKKDVTLHSGKTSDWTYATKTAENLRWPTSLNFKAGGP